MADFATLQQSLSFLDQYILNPPGLLVLLALIPLLLLYLMRPEPEERMMPSLVFFMKEKRKGRMQKALRKLQRNLVLLLHVLFILGVAAAVAAPYIMAEAETDKAVVVLDRSASMKDDMDAVKGFVEENSGGENTLVLVGEEVRVPVENVEKEALMNYVRDMKARDVETDLRSGIETARSYERAVLVASDLGQTVGSGDAIESLESLETSGRDVEVMDTGQRNHWGVVDVEPSRGNSTFDIKNFMAEDRSIDLTGDVSRTVTVPAGSVETVELPTPPGRTEVELEDDPVTADNSAFVSIPDNRSFNVLLVSESGNQYLEKALELISFTSVETVTPHMNQIPEADVYIIGETATVLRSSLEEIENRVENGASAVMFANRGIFDKSSALPVEWTGGIDSLSVEIQEPRRVLVGETSVFSVKKTRGEQMASHNALVKAEHGDGNIVFYNVDDEDFRHNFLYPVFWKDFMEQLTGRPEVEELNLETGETLRSSEVETPSGIENGPVKLTENGFYTVSGQTYAANLVSPEESGEGDGEFEREGTGEGSETQRNLQPLVAALLLLLAMGEFGYLRYRGAI